MPIKPIKVPIVALDQYSQTLNRFGRKVEALNAPVKKLGASMRTVGHEIRGVFTTVAKIGAIGMAAGGGLFALVKSSANVGNNLQNLSAKTGASVKAIQELQYAADQADIPVEEFNSNLIRFGKNASAAAAGTKEQAEVFKALGVRVTDASGKMRSMDEIFTDVVGGISKIPDAMTRTRVAMALFGKSGASMVQMMTGGVDGLNKMREAAARFGLMTEQDAEASARFDSEYKNLIRGLTMSRNIFAAQLFPVFEGLSKRLSEILIDKRPQIIAFGQALAEKLPGAIESIASASVKLYHGLKPAFDLFSRLVKWIGPANLLIGVVSVTIGVKLVSAVYAVASAFSLLNFSVATSPIAIAIAGLGAFAAAAAATVIHFKNLNDEYQRMDQMRRKFGNGPVKITPTEEVKTQKISRLMDLYRKGLTNGNAFSEADLKEQQNLERDLSGEGFDISGDFQTKVGKVVSLWNERSGGNRNAQNLTNESKLTVRFENAPAGTKVKVDRSDVPIDWSIGRSMVQP